MRESAAERWSRRVVLGLLTLFVLTPLYAMASSAAKPLKDVQGAFTWVPSHPTAQASIDMRTTVPPGRYWANSLVAKGTAAEVTVAVAIFAPLAKNVNR